MKQIELLVEDVKLITLDEFLKIVEKHEMTILNEDGYHRSVIFKIPDTIHYSFTLTTWEEHLCISGDIGTYVFRRYDSKDMFYFFYDKDFGINTRYWHEKLTSCDRFNESELFDFIETYNYIAEDLNEKMQNFVEKLDDDEKSCYEDCSEYQEIVDKMEELEELAYETNPLKYAEYLYDNDMCSEMIQMKYSNNLRFAMMAIAWGVKKYIDTKGEKND